ncbi:MAG: cell division protein FtsL, partial [Lachnospiraceae bacterium]|nr:cell division protein FtsL [Lachnospiraceae bacterium]
MAAHQRKRTASGRYAYQRQTTYRDIYVDGNTARELDVRTAIHEKQKKPLSHTARKNREKAHHMNIGYVLFLVAALV